MEKVKVKICAGTACFVMGAPQVQALEFSAPEDLADKIEITIFAYHIEFYVYPFIYEEGAFKIFDILLFVLFGVFDFCIFYLHLTFRGSHNLTGDNKSIVAEHTFNSLNIFLVVCCAEALDVLHYYHLLFFLYN